MNNDILPFWQEIGTSTSIIAKKVSEKLGQPTSHTGTLDPMASGVVLILKGEEYFNKEKFIQKNKTYEFSILFGFVTDTHDGLGLVEKVNQNTDILEESLLRELKSFEGFYHQRYPDFSSKKIGGKSLWEYKRLGLIVPELYIDGEISSIELESFEKVLSHEEILKITNDIKKIKGNFRQEEILSQYDATKFPEYLFKAKVRVLMSRGLYVRGLVRDIAQNFNTLGIVVDLVRSKDGDYTKEDCLNLSEYFSEEIKNNPNFFNPDYKQI